MNELLTSEAAKATDLLLGKIVLRVMRHRDTEVCLEFSDGTRLFVEVTKQGLELSITGGAEIS